MEDRINLPYVVTRQIVNNKTIDMFEVDDMQRRLIREGQVAKLHGLLRTGNHFATPLVVNKLNGYYRMIDGNHRLEALKRALRHNAGLQVEVRFAEYKNLTREEERKVFSDWNSGTKQTAEDFLKIYWETIPFGKQILALPASIYTCKNKIKVKTIVYAHLTAKKNILGRNYSKNRADAVKDFQELDKNDLRYMREFMRFMTEMFGEFSNNEPAWKHPSVMALYKVWFYNMNINETTMKRYIQKVYNLPSNKPLIRDLTAFSTWEGILNFYEFIMGKLQRFSGLKIRHVKDVIAEMESKPKE
jgi:hypothetical protein